MLEVNQQWACEYVEDHYEALRLITCRVLKSNRDERVDEIMSTVMLEKLPNILGAWDPDKGDLDKHVRSNWKWYVWKMLYASDQRKKVEAPWNDVVGRNAAEATLPVGQSLETEELWELLQHRLPSRQWLLVRLRFIEGYTIAQLADHLQLCKGTVNREMKAVLTAVKECLSESGNLD